jgi:ATP-dependent Clp protease ATP-binding subunit ClpC
MRQLQRGRRPPRAKTIRPAERYLLMGADEARRNGHGYIRTEHILNVLTRDPDGSATRLLARLGVGAKAVEAGGGPVGVALGQSARAPTGKEQCKDDGWRNFPQFKNQGECVAFVEPGK